MGRESRLKNAKSESRYEHSNGDRKLYDREKPPDGTDPDVWDLALYFEQLQEENGYLTDGRPVIYTELYHRISKDPDLSQLLRSDTSLTARTRVTVIYDTDESIVSFIKEMIDNYAVMITDSYVSINTFTSKIIFDYLKKYTSDTKKREQLITTGIRKPQPEREKKPSRKTEEEKETYRIITRTYTEDEIQEKFARWKKEHP